MSKNCRLIFIDDNRVEHKLLEIMVRVKNLPVSLKCFSKASDVLTYLEGLTQDEFPHAIITDIKMPDMDGFEFADYFLDNHKSNYPDALLYISSSTIRVEDIERAKGHPAVCDFIEKPINAEKLNEYVLKKNEISE